jgi:predicted  nucleic acid-binding Zn-ribbon protein
MPPRSQQGESKQGLIITLVCFILTTLILAVTTWFGYSEQDRLDKAAKEETRKGETYKNDRDYYKAQAMLYRAYMGMAEGMAGADTLGTLKNQLDSGSLGKGVPDNADVTKTLKALEAKYGWDGNQPKETLEGAINKWKTDYEGLASRNKRTEEELKKTKLDLQRRVQDLEIARKEFEDNLKKLTDKFQQDFTKSNEDLAQFRSKVEQESQKLEEVRKQAEESKKALEATIAKRESEIKDLRALLQRKESELAELQAKEPVRAENIRTDWKITYIDNRGLTPYINLGSADRVKPSLTFTIHGIGVDGRPNPQSKGTLEVVKVLGPHLSQARITSVRDRTRDPIVVNDVIYNASWNPNIKKHVAIAGIIDLTGDGRDSLPEFIRNLERQNIVVDAYLEPSDGQIKGQLTYQTDYLILGGVPERGVGGKSEETEKRLVEGRQQMQEEAKKYGVQIKSLQSYLEMIGYPLPHPIQEATPPRYNAAQRSDIVPRLSRDRFPPPSPSNEKTPPAQPEK